MTGLLESVTQSLLNKSLDASWLNHKVIANNIANVNTANYTAKRIDFDAALANVSQAINDGSSSEAIQGAVQRFDPLSQARIEDTASKVMLDKEMVELMDNTTRYQALINAKSLLGSLNKIAIKGGRS